MKPKKNRIVAALLAFFFGIFGVHRFYLGEGGAGVFFIMLFMFGFTIFKFPVSGILALVDAIRFLTMSPKEFDRRYNRGRGIPSQGRQQGTSRRRQTNEEIYRERQKQSSAKTLSRANPYKKTGLQKYKDYEIEMAITDFEKGLEIEPNDVTLHFNLACAYSLEEKPSKSLYHLQKAVLNGYKDKEKIETHDDLAFLRIQPDFEAFKANGYQVSASISKPKEENLLNDDILLSQLNKLAEMRNRGLLSEEEFVIEKQKLARR